MAVLDYLTLAQNIPDQASQDEVGKAMNKLALEAAKYQANGYLVLKGETIFAAPKSVVIKAEKTPEEL